MCDECHECFANPTNGPSELFVELVFDITMFNECLFFQDSCYRWIFTLFRGRGNLVTDNPCTLHLKQAKFILELFSASKKL